MAQEVWAPIPDYEGIYEASSFGRIRSLDRMVTLRHRNGKLMQRLKKGRVLAPGIGVHGYQNVALSEGGNAVSKSVHVLVAAAFLGPRPDGLDVAHGNGCRTDNRIDNLRYASRTENIHEQFTHGTKPVGEDCPNAKLSNEDVLEIVRLRRSGIGPGAIGRQFGVPSYHVSHIMSGRQWGRVTGIVSDRRLS